MATIVLVHGIDQEQGSADALENEWLPALAGGVRLAGFPTVADSLWRDRSGPGAVETRMAFYGQLFLRPGQQGGDPGELSSDQQELAERLSEEWLERAARQASRPEVRQTASGELAYVRTQVGHEEQGAEQLLRAVLQERTACSARGCRRRIA